MLVDILISNLFDHLQKTFTLIAVASRIHDTINKLILLQPKIKILEMVPNRDKRLI